MEAAVDDVVVASEDEEAVSRGSESLFESSENEAEAVEVLGVGGR